jgi:hypothetical protein
MLADFSFGRLRFCARVQGEIEDWGDFIHVYLHR